MGSEKEGRILVIDDDEEIHFAARLNLKRHFKQVDTVYEQHIIEKMLRENNYDVVLLDMNLSPGATSGAEGLFWLKEIKKLDPTIQVIVNSAYGDIELAVKAMKQGATDFVTKPWEGSKLVATIKSAYKHNQRERELSILRDANEVLETDLSRNAGDIVYGSKAMRNLMKTIEKIAETEANVLILGENGTGKEMVAREIHRKSARAHKPFIKVDLGAIPENLFESELFGHVKGAFTDARDSRAGRFEISNGGTLFLDEIGNLSPVLQTKLLSALQNREITRLGSNEIIKIDIRLVSATNMPLYSMMESNTFRQDLFFRLKTVELTTPPLRDRMDEVGLLAGHFLKILGKKYNKSALTISACALNKMNSYCWPGNIRELQNVLESAVILTEGKEIQADSIQITPRDAAKNTEDSAQSFPAVSMAEVEKKTIQQAISQHGGNLTKAAKTLGMGRATLYRKLEKYGL